MTPSILNSTVAEAARKQLRNISPKPFSIDGLEQLQTSVERYIDDLIIESVRIMKRHDSPSISSHYVTMAAQNIVRRRRRKLMMFVGVLGGALLSAAFSFLYEMMKTPPTPITILGAFLLFAAGMALIGFQIARE